MALIKCAVCQYEVSEDAKVCPKCGTAKPWMSKGRRTLNKVAPLVFVGVFLVGTCARHECNRDDRGYTRIDSPASVTAPAMAETPPSVPTNGGPTPATGHYDELGTQKRSGPFAVTLTDAKIQGKAARLSFLLKNDADQEAAVSSMMMFQATNDDGEKGDVDPTGSCDGTAPPHGAFKCKLLYEFEKSPKEMTVRVGATLRSEDAVYFKIKVGAK